MSKHLTDCACSDPGCPSHPGQSRCLGRPSTVLRRVDMQDQTPIPMCGWCADDAMGSGVFTQD